MSFLTPFFLLLGLLAVPIILMYMLRLRRQEMLVSSALLWQKLLRDREANRPWQRLRRNLLLILQLLILAALILALARPYLPIPTLAGGNLVVLLDGSASMLAADESPNRFNAAQAEAAQLINNLSGDNRMTLILVGRTPTVLAAATNDRTLLRSALETARAQPAAADWRAAFALAAGAAQGYEEARVVIISDGNLPANLPPLPADVVFTPVGRSGENLAISALAARETTAGPELLLSVTNYGQAAHTPLISLALDDRLFDSRRVTVAGGETRHLTWILPAETETIAARLSSDEGNYLALDDAAWAVRQGRPASQIELVGRDSFFLEQFYAIWPGAALYRTTHNDAAPENEERPFADLYIYDTHPLPDPPPPANLLIINPPESHSLLTTNGVFTATTVTRLAGSPLLQFVEWSGVNVRRATRVDAPWAETLIQAQGGPLLLAGERDGYRIAIFTFDLHDSDLPLRVAFPLLMANLTDWLIPGQPFDATAYRPGDVVALQPGPGATALAIEKPDGSVWRQPVGEGPHLFNETMAAGLYRVTVRDSQGDRPAGVFAVNLFAPEESAIAPAREVQIGQDAVAAVREGEVGRREIWPWLIGAALAILAVEWWVYYRGNLFT